MLQEKLLTYAGLMLFVMGLCQISCKKNAVADFRHISNIKTVDKDIDLTPYIYDLSFIPLGEGKGLNLRMANRYFFYDDMIIVQENKRNSNIYIYDLDGKFKELLNYSIADLPEKNEDNAFGSIDFTVDQERGYVYVSNSYQKCVLKHDLKSRLNKIVIKDVQGISIIYHKDFLYLLTMDKENGLLKIVDTKNFTQSESCIYDSKPEVGVGATTSNNMIIKEDNILLSLFMSDTIYCINKYKFLPYYILGTTPEVSVRFAQLKELDYYYYEERIDKYPNLLAPWGEIGYIHNALFLQLFTKKWLVINLKNDDAYIIPYTSVSRNNQLFSTPFVYSLNYQDEYYGSYIKLTYEFYELANKLINSKVNPSIIQALQVLIQDYPPEREFQNPVITRFKIRENFMDELN
ncbi:MAG TPA: hypothetical protein PKC30_14750 [Saprospiraceae bacterium]|nr:hypothetical protein [Saprospiraceae bacterium]